MNYGIGDELKLSGDMAFAPWWKSGTLLKIKGFENSPANNLDVMYLVENLSQPSGTADGKWRFETKKFDGLRPLLMGSMPIMWEQIVEPDRLGFNIPYNKAVAVQKTCRCDIRDLMTDGHSNGCDYKRKS